jgi:mannose-6-phosphate isomerase-like protein (cupin superfamily)
MADNEAGKTYQRPWGSYQTLAIATGYQVKIITIVPKGRLSLQKHQHRSEHWIVAYGNPTLTLEDVKREYRVDEYIYIPQGALHRIENFSNENCVLVEVQIGGYLGEDDIIRIEDVYGRESSDS